MRDSDTESDALQQLRIRCSLIDNQIGWQFLVAPNPFVVEVIFPSMYKIRAKMSCHSPGRNRVNAASKACVNYFLSFSSCFSNPMRFLFHGPGWSRFSACAFVGRRPDVLCSPQRYERRAFGILSPNLVH